MTRLLKCLLLVLICSALLSGLMIFGYRGLAGVAALLAMVFTICAFRLAGEDWEQ